MTEKPKRKMPSGPKSRGHDVPDYCTETEASFCHFWLTRDAHGKQRTKEECARLAGLPTDDLDNLVRSARVRDYCKTYSDELARQMARQEAMRRADYELSPMAIAGEMFYILRHGEDERAQVAAGAKLLDWMGDSMDARMKIATAEDLRYFVANNHWPEERMLHAPKVEPPPARAAAPQPEPVTVEAVTVGEWNW